MEEPKQITPTKLADYLGVLTKAVFESGMSWKVVENKWPGFQAAFHGFDPETVASLSPDEIDALTNDTRIIRNRRKIEATVHNAGVMLDLERETGGFKIRRRRRILGDRGGHAEAFQVRRQLWRLLLPLRDRPACS